ncbi:MAG: GNAT family N-acetyltransferase [Clostridia bacterium]|nr:GNAT family N-acetyltransferase [Clostridia bacterium]
MDTERIRLVPMTDEMFHVFYQGFENDPCLCRPDQPYVSFRYSGEWVDRYIRRQKDLNRVPLAIICGDEIVGEIIFKDIAPHARAGLSITLRNDGYKGRGIGTQALTEAVRYAFTELDLGEIFADALKTNMRSRLVLEKAGFLQIREDAEFVYYRIGRERNE